MKDMEDRLRDLGVVTWNADLTLPSSTRSTIKRRRTMSVFAGGIVASTMVLGIASLAPADIRTVPPSGKPSVAAEGRGTPTPGEREPDLSREPIARDDFYGAVWPEDERAETAQGCAEAGPDTFRTSAMGTAVEFGRAVLGWEGAEGSARGAHRNSIQVELTSGHGNSAVDLSMVEYLDGCWSVQSVTPADDIVPIMWDRKPAADGQTNVLSVAFDPPGGAAGRVEMAYGDQLQSRPFTAAEVNKDSPLVFTFGPIGPYEAGHAFIFFEDEDGRVTTAFGAALNPQKGGARADGLP